MEGFERDEEDVEMDALSDRELMEVLQDRADVFTGTGVCEEAGSRVLDVLQFEDFGWCTVQNTAAVVDSDCDKGMD